MDIIPELNDRQLDRLSEFLSNLSLLIVATLVIPNVIGTDKPNIFELLLGIILTIVLLLASMVIIRKD